DLVQPANTLPSGFLRSRGGHRMSASYRNFPASPPTTDSPVIDTLMPLAELRSARSGDHRQSGPFRFDRHGGAVVREVSRGYNRMCDSLSSHVWNEPEGKRICFDTRGKPGIAIRIPIK